MILNTKTPIKIENTDTTFMILHNETERKVEVRWSTTIEL